MTPSVRNNLLALAVGVATLAALLYWVRASDALQHLAGVWGWVVLLVLAYGGVQALFTAGWMVLIEADPRPVGFWKLFRVYIAGDAVNYVVVSGNLAGEPLKAYLLRDRLPMVKGLSSVTLNKLSEAVSMILFEALGVVLAFSYHLLTPGMAWGTLFVFVLMSFGIFCFFWRTKKGMFGWMFRLFSRIGVARAFFERIARKAEALDSQISGFYDTGGSRFLLSLLFNFLGWAGGALEGYCLLIVLGVDASLPMVVAIETIHILSNNLFFFVPGRLGGSDTGKVLAFRAMGMASSLGLAFTVLRRAREVFYAALGFLFLLQMNPLQTRIFSGIPDGAPPADLPAAEPDP